MPPKSKRAVARDKDEVSLAKKTKETPENSEAENAPDKQCSSQSVLAQLTCNCPCTCGKPRVLQPRYEEEGDKEDEILREKCFREAYCQGVVELWGKIFPNTVLQGKWQNDKTNTGQD